MELVLLVRYGELGLKGMNRPEFEKALVNNIRQALDGLEFSAVRKERGRVFVEGVRPDDRVELLSRLGRVFGVVSFSPAMACDLDIEEMKQAALMVAREAVSRLPAGCRTFKVAANRANKQFSYTSMEMNHLFGGLVLKNIPGLSVDVHNPGFTLTVEVRERAFIYSETIPGPGGLPYGTSGKAMLLLSGGIDSPVAGWLSMKRGIEVEAVHFYSFPFTGEKSKAKVVDLCRVLAAWAGRITLHVVPFTEIQTKIMERCEESLRVTVARRMMFRIAEELAVRRGALALITGESVGQVASQTLESIRAVNAVTTLPVLRPLAGFDKVEIVDIARRIGTFEISIRPYEDCCSLFAPKHPKTRPKLGESAENESRLEVHELVKAAADATETIVIAR